MSSGSMLGANKVAAYILVQLGKRAMPVKVALEGTIAWKQHCQLHTGTD